MRKTQLLAATLCALLVAALPATASEISYSDVRATVEESSDGILFSVENSRGSETLPPGTDIMILEDGIFAFGANVALQAVFHNYLRHDAEWHSIKATIEAISVETDDNDHLTLPGEPIPLVYELAFRAGLDNNPRTALRQLEERGVQFQSALEPGWIFDPDNAQHRERALRGLDILGRSMNGRPLRVGGSASRLFLGFPIAPETRSAPILWPLDPDQALRLAPKKGGDAYASQEIGRRLLTGQPGWFVPDSRIGPSEAVGCLPFGGCGYLDQDAVLPVRAIWITFDRVSRVPLMVTVE